MIYRAKGTLCNQKKISRLESLGSKPWAHFSKPRLDTCKAVYHPYLQEANLQVLPFLSINLTYTSTMRGYEVNVSMVISGGKKSLTVALYPDLRVTLKSRTFGIDMLGRIWLANSPLSSRTANSLWG